MDLCLLQNAVKGVQRTAAEPMRVQISRIQADDIQQKTSKMVGEMVTFRMKA